MISGRCKIFSCFVKFCFCNLFHLYRNQSIHISVLLLFSIFVKYFLGPLNLRYRAIMCCLYYFFCTSFVLYVFDIFIFDQRVISTYIIQYYIFISFHFNITLTIHHNVLFYHSIFIYMFDDRRTYGHTELLTEHTLVAFTTRKENNIHGIYIVACIYRSNMHGILVTQNRKC